MKQLQYSIKDTHSQVAVQLSILTFKEGDVYFMYSPELDIVGYGKTGKEASSSFDVVLNQFFTFTITNNTFHKEMKRLGWKLSDGKSGKAPELPKMVSDRDYLVEIMQNDYRKSSKEFTVCV
jgi:hypothetical protein